MKRKIKYSIVDDIDEKKIIVEREKTLHEYESCPASVYLAIEEMRKDAELEAYRKQFKQ